MPPGYRQLMHIAGFLGIDVREYESQYQGPHRSMDAICAEISVRMQALLHDKESSAREARNPLNWSRKRLEEEYMWALYEKDKLKRV